MVVRVSSMEKAKASVAASKTYGAEESVNEYTVTGK